MYFDIAPNTKFAKASFLGGGGMFQQNKQKHNYLGKKKSHAGLTPDGLNQSFWLGSV